LGAGGKGGAFSGAPLFFCAFGLFAEWRAASSSGRASALLHVASHRQMKHGGTMLGTLLLVILILLLIGAFPAWPHSRSWGYAPSGTLGVVLIIVIVLVVMGTI
jgi:hypothetical protein